MESPKQNIHASYEGLSKVQRKIANYVLENYSDIMTMTLADLSSAVEVAESSIIRFTDTLGYSGFTEFKLAIASSHNETKDFLDEIVAEENSLEYTLKQYAKLNMENIKDNYDHLDYDNIEAIAQLFLSKERIFIVAQQNHTGNVAEDFYNRLRSVLPNIRLARSIHEVTKDSQILDRDDLVFAISFTGTTETPLLLAKNAKEAGATLAVLTSARTSPLYNYSDFSIIPSVATQQLGVRYPAGLIHFRIITESIYFYIKNQTENRPI